jgi:hypothetical protein
MVKVEASARKCVFVCLCVKNKKRDNVLTRAGLRTGWSRVKAVSVCVRERLCV